MCPGKEIADQSLHINVATLLWACDIEKPVGAAGPSADDFIDNNLVM